MGAGKSHIAANLLAWDPGIYVIETDEFATPEATSNDCKGRTDLTRLWAAASDATRESERIVFAGVCLEELLPSARFERGFRVYIKRVCPLWHDGLDLDATEPAADWLHEDILRYHRTWRPHDLADLCVAVPEGQE
jgi:hypothetical protein